MSKAKRQCIEIDIAPFIIGELTGAIQYSGEEYLNFLPRSKSNERIRRLKRLTKQSLPPNEALDEASSQLVTSHDT